MNRTVTCLNVLCFASLVLSDVARGEAPYNVAWSRQIGTTDTDQSFGVAVDAAGNAYISGWTYGSLGGPNAGGADAFLSKYDGAGNFLWSRQVGTTDNDESHGVAVDAAGNAYISGRTQGSLGGPNLNPPTYDAFLSKYDGGGNLLWSRQFGTTNNDKSNGVAVDASGNAYISGFINSRAIEETADAFLAKYDGAGNLIWSRSIGTTDTDQSEGVAVDAAGNAYISGWTQGSLGGPFAGFNDAFLTKYDGAGNHLWSRQIGTISSDQSYSVAVDAAGNAYISGETRDIGGPTAGREDAFLSKYDNGGNLLWSRQIGTTDLDLSYGVAVDAAGNAYISGYTFGGLVGPNAGVIDAFLTKYDGAGNLLWSRQIGTTGGDASNGVAVDATGNAYISGTTFGSLGGPNAGGDDAFLVKFAPPIVSTYEGNRNEGFTVIKDVDDETIARGWHKRFVNVGTENPGTTTIPRRVPVPILEIFTNDSSQTWTGWHEEVLSTTVRNGVDGYPEFLIRGGSVFVYRNNQQLIEHVDYSLVVEPYFNEVSAEGDWRSVSILLEPHAAIQPGDTFRINQDIFHVFNVSDGWIANKAAVIAQGPLVESVPEPSSFVVAALAGIVLLPFRSRGWHRLSTA